MDALQQHIFLRHVVIRLITLERFTALFYRVAIHVATSLLQFVLQLQCTLLVAQGR